MDNNEVELIIDKNGNKYYVLKNSILNKKGFDSYNNKILHREDGPAIEFINGSKVWYLNGLLHREKLPTIELTDGTKEYYINGLRHREDGPAIENSISGIRIIIAEGLKHSLNSRFRIKYNKNYWYLYNKELTEEQFNNYLLNKELNKNLIKRIESVNKIKI